VASDLENYLRTVKRAEELDKKIAKINDLIEEMLYDLYELSDEEIGVIEEATTE